MFGSFKSYGNKPWVWTMKVWTICCSWKGKRNVMNGISFKKILLNDNPRGHLKLGSVGILRPFFFSWSCSQEMSVTSFCNCVEYYLFHPNSRGFFCLFVSAPLPHNVLVIISAFRKKSSFISNCSSNSFYWVKI